MEKCVGCGKRDGDPCADCLELLDGVIVVRRSLILEVVVILVFGLPAAGTFWLYWDSWEWGPGERILMMTALLLVPVVWGGHSLTKAFRYRLGRETLDVQRVLGSSETFNLPDVDSDLGHVVELRGNRRFWVGEAQFPGADRFHRALRVRRARVAGSQTA